MKNKLTIEAIKDLSKRLKDYKIIIISNREPYVHNFDKEEIVINRPAGGVVTALDPLLQSDMDAVWVAWGSGSADAATVDETNRVLVPPENPKYYLKRVWLHEELINGYYFGFSNKTLWPLSHNSFVVPKFSEKNWILYNHANDLFTKSAIEELDEKKKNIIFINDYHLSLIASKLKTYTEENQQYNLKMVMFWHIPWPTWEAFRILPWKTEILDSMLTLNVLGVQTSNDKFNFLRTVQQEYDDYDIDFETGFVTKPDGSKTLIKDFSISIDYNDFQEIANRKEINTRAHEIQKTYNNLFIIVSVDRLDYIKGLIQRQRAIDRFFTRYPEYLEKVIFIQIVSPSRSEIDIYSNLAEELQEFVDKINMKFRKIDYHDENEDISWQPILYIPETLPREEIISYYRAAGAVLVSSIQDGMNLVTKEAIASGKDDLAILLSRWAGASSHLKESILFNPFNINEFADSIKKVLDLSKEDKKQRISSMKDKVKNYNIYDWIIDIFSSTLEFID